MQAGRTSRGILKLPRRTAPMNAAGDTLVAHSHAVTAKKFDMIIHSFEHNLRAHLTSQACPGGRSHACAWKGVVRCRGTVQARRSSRAPFGLPAGDGSALPGFVVDTAAVVLAVEACRGVGGVRHAAVQGRVNGRRMTAHPAAFEASALRVENARARRLGGAHVQRLRLCAWLAKKVFPPSFSRPPARGCCLRPR